MASSGLYADYKKDSQDFSFFYNDVIFLNDAKIYFNDIRSYDLVQFYSNLYPF